MNGSSVCVTLLLSSASIQSAKYSINSFSLQTPNRERKEMDFAAQGIHRAKKKSGKGKYNIRTADLREDEERVKNRLLFYLSKILQKTIFCTFHFIKKIV